MSEVILEVKNLKKYFKTPNGMLHAVDDVSFTIEKGKTLGVVGESGCGKTTTGRTILRLVEPTSGQIIFDGVDITALSKEEMRKKRGEMQLIGATTITEYRRHIDKDAALERRFQPIQVGEPSEEETLAIDVFTPLREEYI